jgi:cyclopropane-fatty-acyl-phospholipid synthase
MATEVALEPSVASTLEPLVGAVFGAPPPVRIELWDGSAIGPGTGPRGGPGTLRIRSAEAVRHLLWAPGELGLARAYVSGGVDADGDLYALLRVLQDAVPERPEFSPRLLSAAAAAARELGLRRGRPAPPPEEGRPRGRRHSRRRDGQAVSHHYDVGNDFYRLLLGPSLTYSCARFPDPATSLEDAQASKHELICRKLGLGERPGMRLLDVGCGWGSMALHAAAHHGAQVVGVTISEEQATLARERVAEAGLADQVEIRLQDYRDVDDGPYDAISSIGMFEHVGAERTSVYFGQLRELLAPTGRLLNHAISSVGGSVIGSRTFMGRYVFPDAQLLDVGEVALAMQRAGFELRDVESLREHYARTLRCWVDHLRSRWDEAVALIGERRARVWLLYLSGCTLAFEDGGISVHQVLGVVPAAGGASGMPPTRAGWG